jgi:gamma-glutamylputrescine oxidase
MTLSYWQIKNMARQEVKTEKKPEAGTYNIAIIGAGIVGVALAYYLKLMGCDKVVVLEKNFCGYGASGRNAGFLIAGMAEPYSRLVVGMGREGARTMMQSTVENHNLMAEAISKCKINCEYVRSGSYHLSLSDTEYRELLESTSLLQDDGFGGEFINSSEIAARLGFGKFNGGYYNPLDGCLDPYAFVKGLSEEIDIIEDCEIRLIEKQNGQAILRSRQGAIRAEMAILATNAYSPLVDSHFNNLIFPVRGQMLATGPGISNPLGDKTYYANFGYEYFRQSSDNVILMGGLRNRFIESETGYEDELNPQLQKEMEDYIHEHIGVDAPGVSYRWTGVMGNTIDGLPLVGPLPHNNAVLAAVGYNGHGFGLGMIVARDVARALLDGETSDLLRRFSIKRFPK